MRQYSSDTVNTAWQGLNWSEGVATGTFITEARTAPSFSAKVNARGKLTRSYSPDRSGTVTILVDQESALHQQLLALAEKDRDPNQRDVVDVMVIDEPGIAKTRYENAFILTEPDETRGVESVSFPWVFMFEAKTPEPKTTPDNLVGN